MRIFDELGKKDLKGYKEVEQTLIFYFYFIIIIILYQ
jgi:hypothetical protein